MCQIFAGDRLCQCLNFVLWGLFYNKLCSCDSCAPKPGIYCTRLPRAAVRARQTRSCVYALITVFVSGIEARQPRAAVDWRRERNTERHKTVSIMLKEHSTLNALCSGTKDRFALARHARSSRAATWYRLCEGKQRTMPRAAGAHTRNTALSHVYNLLQFVLGEQLCQFWTKTQHFRDLGLHHHCRCGECMPLWYACHISAFSFWHIM
jgi:hypothetical protein